MHVLEGVWWCGIRLPQVGGGYTIWNDSDSNIFVPIWSFRSDSHLYVRTNAIEFARHAFPPTAVADMESMGSPTMAHNMFYAAVHAMLYLVGGSHCIQLLNEMEVPHDGFTTREVELWRQVCELERDVRGFDHRYALLSSMKTNVKKFCSALEMKVDSQTQENEGLMIQNESL